MTRSTAKRRSPRTGPPSPFTVGGVNVSAGPASFSPDRRYRYTLWRTWDESKPTVMVIGLNPSTADENHLDNTLKKCAKLAHSWGYGSFVMTNLFAFRATDPLDMKACFEPVGPQNDAFLRELAFACKLVLAAWGTHGGWLGRDQQVIQMLTRRGVNLSCLKLTKDGHPWHPLYVKDSTRPMRFRPAVV